MLSIEECRKSLGKNYKDLPDEEVQKIRDFLYEITNMVLKETEVKNHDNKETNRGK